MEIYQLILNFKVPFNLKKKSWLFLSSIFSAKWICALISEIKLHASGWENCENSHLLETSYFTSHNILRCLYLQKKYGLKILFIKINYCM